MKTIQFVVVVTVFINSFFIAACTKSDIEKCQSNCADIIISGKAWDSSAQKGLANLPVRVYWQDAGMCPICPEDQIASTKTDGDGNFYIDMQIDRLRFNGNRLHVQVSMPLGYVGNGSHNGVLDESTGQYQRLFQNKFTMYQAANLNIKLQRTQTDNFISFELKYLFDYTTGGIYYRYGPPPLPYTEFIRVAGANVFTKVTWVKGYGFGMSATFTDSIKCVANTSNTIVLDY
jgi:hypothetical protein